MSRNQDKGKIFWQYEQMGKPQISSKDIVFKIHCTSVQESVAFSKERNKIPKNSLFVVILSKLSTHP